MIKIKKVFNKSRMKNIIKKNKLSFKISNKFVSLFHDIRRLLLVFISKIFYLFPIKNNKIVICSYYGKGYGDNGKYIVEEIIDKSLNYDIVWLANSENIDRKNFPIKVRIVKYMSLKSYYEMITSKIWIDNSRKEYIPKKRPTQKYIQTWHGGISLKKIEKDAESTLSDRYIKMAKKDSLYIDYLISNSSFCTSMYKRAFWYNGEILEIGSPRCDILINNNDISNNKINEYFNISSRTKIALYAPTFRNSHSTDFYDINFDEFHKNLEKNFGGDWVVLVRLHPNITNKAQFLNYNSTILNASEYSDMHELMKRSDLLITDYSSSMFEFGIMKKLVILYAKDINAYKKERDFYFDLYSLPFPIVKSNDNLNNLLKNINIKDYKKNLELFYKKINHFERGEAAKYIVTLINNLTENI